MAAHRATAAPGRGSRGFFAEVSAPDRPCCIGHLLFGGGQQVEWGASEAGCAPGAKPFETEYTYNRGARWEFLLQATTPSCEGHSATYGSLYGVIEVAPGPSRAQGPRLPVVSAVLEARAPGEPVEPGFLKLWAKARDEDGFIDRFMVEWGDGTAIESYPGDPMGCRPTPSGWPAPSDASLREPYPQHRYAAPGTYQITVTAHSSGCDGGEEQLASASMPYTW